MNIGIVTGASSGMGRAFAIKLSNIYKNKLDEIWIIARREDRLVELKNEIEKRIFKNNTKDFVKIIVLDLTDSYSFKYLEKKFKNLKPKILFLVNAAGFGTTKNIENSDRNLEEKMIQTNVLALSNMTHVALPYMAKNSTIYQFASAAAFMPQPGFASYAATKAFVLSYSRALKHELKYKNVNVVAICPGPVDTEFFKIAGTEGSIKVYKKYFFVKPENVVNKAIKDRKKDMSIYGIPMNAFFILTKILPHKLIMNVASKLH